MSHLELALLNQMRAHKVPEPEQQYRFAAMATGGTGKGCRQRLKEAKLRDWRFDFCWPSLMIAVEIEGGLYVNGRHNRAAGFEADLEKYRHATLQGWQVFRCGAKMIKSGDAIATIKQLINYKAEK